MKAIHKIFDSFSLSNDKAINEVGVVEIVLECLKIDPSTLKSAGDQDPPDCIMLWDSSTLGIEVVALVDDDARKLNAYIRKKQSNKENLDWTKEYYADWSQVNFRTKLHEIVDIKEGKISRAKLDGKAAADCSSLWLVIHADEAFLTSVTVREYLETWKLSSKVFARVYLLLSYEPGRDDTGYPLFLLN
jgi:hypothetical protein